MSYQPGERRPLASRDLPIMKRCAAWLIAARVPPNAISAASVVFAALAGLCLAATAGAGSVGARLLFVLAALGVQGRLLANLFDGMVAVGSGTASPVGELYNDVPDRISDVLILVGLGSSLGGLPELGWVASVLALFTAYLRVLGGSLGAANLFIGPMAKQQRMAVVTAACAAAALLPSTWLGGFASGLPAPRLALYVIVAGAVLTSVRRLRSIAAQLRARA